MTNWQSMKYFTLLFYVYTKQYVPGLVQSIITQGVAAEKLISATIIRCPSVFLDEIKIYVLLNTL